MWTSYSERMVEVCDNPAGTKHSTLTLMLESSRHTGLTGVTVDSVEFMTEDHSRALVTLCTAEGSLMTVCVVSTCRVGKKNPKLVVWVI